jgi:flagellar FliL protein
MGACALCAPGNFARMSKKEKPPKPPKPPKKGKKGAEAKTEGEGAEGAEAKEGEVEGGEAPAKKKLAGKTLVLFIILPAILLLGGGGAAAYFLFFSKPPTEVAAGEHGGEHKEAKKKSEHGGEGKEGANAAIKEGENGAYYYTMPEMLVNITSGDGRPVYLKLKLTLEAPDEDVAYAIEPQLPRVTDQFQAFLRELRVDDLAGSAGAYRLRLELLRRVNLAVAPAQVNAVLIEEMLVQ